MQKAAQPLLASGFDHIECIKVHDRLKSTFYFNPGDALTDAKITQARDVILDYLRINKVQSTLAQKSPDKFKAELNEKRYFIIVSEKNGKGGVAILSSDQDSKEVERLLNDASHPLQLSPPPVRPQRVSRVSAPSGPPLSTSPAQEPILQSLDPAMIKQLKAALIPDLTTHLTTQITASVRGEFQSQLTVLSGEITELQEERTDQVRRIETLENQISQLTATVAQRDQTIAELRAQNAQLRQQTETGTAQRVQELEGQLRDAQEAHQAAETARQAAERARQAAEQARVAAQETVTRAQETWSLRILAGRYIWGFDRII